MRAQRTRPQRICGTSRLCEQERDEDQEDHDDGDDLDCQDRNITSLLLRDLELSRSARLIEPRVELNVVGVDLPVRFLLRHLELGGDR